MKNKFIFLLALTLIIAITIYLNSNLRIPIWEQNALELSQSFNLISGTTATIDDLSDFTKFEWDTLYSFQPYLPEEEIYKIVGYRWDDISATVNEGMNQLVFLKDGDVVCYVYGYPEKYNVYFEFGQYNNNHFKLTTSNNLEFEMKVFDGVRYFEYISVKYEQKGM